jgi:hypothetical protein
MALFTILTGNAFAAFPIMASAIAVPLLLNQHGGDPAVVGAIGMLAGFCGTLMTPMAANFNLVPAAPAGAQGSQRGDQGADRHGAAAAGGQYPLHLVVRILMAHKLTPQIAQRFAEAALGHVTREYPHKLDHVMDGPEDVASPRDLIRSSSAASTGTAACTVTGC